MICWGGGARNIVNMPSNHSEAPATNLGLRCSCLTACNCTYTHYNGGVRYCCNASDHHRSSIERAVGEKASSLGAPIPALMIAPRHHA